MAFVNVPLAGEGINLDRIVFTCSDFTNGDMAMDQRAKQRRHDNNSAREIHQTVIARLYALAMEQNPALPGLPPTNKDGMTKKVGKKILRLLGFDITWHNFKSWEDKKGSATIVPHLWDVDSTCRSVKWPEDTSRKGMQWLAALIAWAEDYAQYLKQTNRFDLQPFLPLLPRGEAPDDIDPDGKAPVARTRHAQRQPQPPPQAAAPPPPPPAQQLRPANEEFPGFVGANPMFGVGKGPAAFTQQPLAPPFAEPQAPWNNREYALPGVNAPALLPPMQEPAFAPTSVAANAQMFPGTGPSQMGPRDIPALGEPPAFFDGFATPSRPLDQASAPSSNGTAEPRTPEPSRDDQLIRQLDIDIGPFLPDHLDIEQAVNEPVDWNDPAFDQFFFRDN